MLITGGEHGCLPMEEGVLAGLSDGCCPKRGIAPLRDRGDLLAARRQREYILS
jgi:hypothetical protein